MQVELLQQLTPDRLAGTALEEHIIGYDHGGAAGHGEHRRDVLYEVELLVRRRDPEVVTAVGDVFPAGRPSAPTTVMDDFVPNGGLASTTLG